MCHWHLLMKKIHMWICKNSMAKLEVLIPGAGHGPGSTTKKLYYTGQVPGVLVSLFKTWGVLTNQVPTRFSPWWFYEKRAQFLHLIVSFSAIYIRGLEWWWHAQGGSACQGKRDGFDGEHHGPGDQCALIEQAADRVDMWREIEVRRLIELYYYFLIELYIPSLSLLHEFHLGSEAEVNLLHKEFWRKMSPM